MPPKLIDYDYANAPMGGSSEDLIPGRRSRQTPLIPGMGQAPEMSEDDYVPGADDGDETYE